MFDSVSASGFTAAICASQNISSPPYTSPIALEENAQPTKTTKKGSANLKIKFTPEEDQKLSQLVLQHGSKDWIKISTLMETRNPRQCRERWNNYLNPSLRTDPFSTEEDLLLDQKYAEYGPRWNKIAKFFNNRSDNSLRNRWMMIARHRAKHQKSPVSPPQVAPTTKHNTVSLPRVEAKVEPIAQVVIPAVKEVHMPEVKTYDSSFELLGFPSVQFSEFDSEPFEFDMWNDFSFY